MRRPALFLLALGFALTLSTFAALPTPDPDDGAPNGSGAPGMQPALTSNLIVAGDTNRLIAGLLKGPAAVLPADREKFSNVMPPSAVLNDADLARVLTYLRKNFAPGSPDVTAAQVAARRQSP